MNWRKLSRLWPWLAAAGTGLLATACFPPFKAGWLCWLCLTPLLAALWFSGETKRRWLRDILLGYLAGLIFFWAAFSWLTTVTVPGWFLLQFYMGLYFAFWAWFCGRLRPPPLPSASQLEEQSRPNKWDQMLAEAGRPAVLPPASRWMLSGHNILLATLAAAVWVTMEWLRGWVFSGFGWNGLGVALHDNWLIIQIAEYTGVAGLSFTVAFVNVIALATVVRLFLETRTRVMRPHFDVTLTMSALIGLLAFGWHAARLPRPAQPLRIAAVQANIARAEKFDPAYTQKIFDQFQRLSGLALHAPPPPDLLIWPESSMPGPVLVDQASNQFVMKFVQSLTTDLLLGTIDVEGNSDYNAALLVTQGGQELQVYRKLHLVPFGEYIPGRHAVPLFAQIIGDQVPGDFAVGHEYSVFRLTNNKARLAPLICFEDTIGELVRRFVLPAGNEPGANLLANLTNDGWFKESAGSRQHLANALFRCVETRRPMVRAANTGVTCIINELGRVTQVLQDDRGYSFSEGILVGDVNVPSEPALTFYVRHGELFAKCCAGITAVAFPVVLLLAWRRQRAAAAERREIRD